MCPISFFENKRVIDVACGDKFTVVVAEVFPNRKMEINLSLFQEDAEKTTEVAGGLLNKLQKAKAVADGVRSNRKPVCGGDNVSD